MNKTVHKIYVGSFFLVGIAVVILLAIHGYQYYSSPVEERFFLEEHTSLKPSGMWGHAFGIIGTLMMIFGVAIYMIRKRTRRFFNVGYLKHWLEFHIFLCSVGPVLVLYHTAFKFGGIVAVSFWSMVAVVLSGVIGRFIYIQIPHSISGQEMGMNELTELTDDVNQKLKGINEKLLSKLNAASSSEKFKKVTIGESFVFILKDYLSRRSILSELKRELRGSSLTPLQFNELLSAAKTKLIISRRIGMLRIMQKMFRYWHIIHLPFAIAMFAIMIVHVGVTIAFGYKWIF